MSLWKDKSGLKQQGDEPSIIERKMDQIHALECEKGLMQSEKARRSANAEQTRLIRELENDQGVTVTVDRHRPGFFRFF